MNVPPVSLAVIALDLGSLAAGLSALFPAVEAVRRWNPASAERSQLGLERRVEAALPAFRLSAGLSVLASLLLLGAVAAVLPELVPGAMCGSGVLQAAGGAGSRALALRGLALVLLWSVQVAAALQRHRPEAPLTVVWATAVLLSFPVTALAAGETARMLLGLDAPRPVDCCAAPLEASRGEGGTSAVPSPRILLPAAATGLVLGGAALVGFSPRARRRPFLPALLGLVALAWLPLATGVFFETLAPYHHGVLGHRCGWCLLLPRQHGVGLLLLAGAFAVALEAVALVLVAGLRRAFPDLGEEADGRLRRASLHLALAVVVLVGVAAGPAAWWLFRFGTTMAG